MRGRDLVGRDVVAQLGIIGRIRGVPGQFPAVELADDKFRIFGEEENASLQANFIGAFVDLAIQQRGDHFPILLPGDRLGTEMLKRKPQRTRRFTKGFLRVIRG